MPEPHCITDCPQAPENMSKMKCVRRISINEEFEVCPNNPIPDVPPTGARVKVCYAGACYTDKQVKKSGKRRLSCPGVKDTSLFTGFEVSGIVDELGKQPENNNFQVGDRVIIYPDCNECFQETGYDEYVTVNDVRNLVQVPNKLRLDIASLLPSGGLKAYSAVVRAKPFILEKSRTQDRTNVLIVGAGGLGLWTLKLAQTLIKADSCKIHVTVADTSVEKLILAQDYGCTEVVHWHDALHEEQILERTKNQCIGGVDVVIDFVSSPRTIKRSLKVLRDEGILIVGGNSKYEFTFNLATLAQKEQSVLGVNRGTRKQLNELVDLMMTGELKPPCYSIFPVDEANDVFNKLTHCQINGRAVLEVCPEDMDVFVN